MTGDGGNRAIWTLLAGLLCSSLGSIVLNVVLGLQVYDITERELDLGLLGLVEFAPAALLVLLTGSVADRHDRRKIAGLSMLGEAAAVVGLLAYVATDPTAVGPVFAIVFVFGVARAFAAPASRSLPADIVEPARLPWVVARYAATWQLAAIVGPAAGALLYDLDKRVPYVLVVVLLIAGAAAVVSVPREHPADLEEVVEEALPVDPALAPAPPATRFGEAIEGLRFIRSQPILLGAISLDLFAVLFGGAVQLLPALVDKRLGASDAVVGLLRAAGGAGAALMTLRLALRPIERRVGRTLLIAVAVFGVATIVLGATTSLLVATIAMFVLMGADSISVFIRSTLVPLVTPKDKRGRVLAVEMVFIGASNELGGFESGVAGQALGPAGAIVLGGAATLAVAGGWMALFPDLRDVDAFPVGADA